MMRRRGGRGMGRDAAAGIRHGEGRSGMPHAEVYFVMGV